jgi:hypothetical protein
MPNLINTYADNVFYNYATPLVRGESAAMNNTDFNNGLTNFFTEKLGAVGTAWRQDSGFWFMRFPAPGLEMKTGNMSSGTQLGFQRAAVRFFARTAQINANTANTNNLDLVGDTLSVSLGTSNASNVSFACINDYALTFCYFTDNTFSVLRKFCYVGWLREPSFTGTSIGVRGLCVINRTSIPSLTTVRPTTENATASTNLSNADNSITNPPITCGGDASDIIIRDDSAPNYAIGKLWNCVSLPNEAVVGQIWKNTGPDVDGYTESDNTNKYLVVMPWGGRKLGMRIWTEGFV